MSCRSGALGAGSRACVVTLVERKIGKLANHTAASLSRRLARLIRGAGRVETVTADSGTEFHGYERVERLTGAAFYFARPYHS